MTQDEIIEMAQKAGIDFDLIDDDEGQIWYITSEGLKAFATLVAATEREACAKEADHWQKITDKAGRINKDGEYIAAAIRAMKQ